MSKQKLTKLPLKKLQKNKAIITSNNLELELFSKGFTKVIGIDEAGRGAWAGPVSVGFYIYEPHTIPIPNVTDSKKIPPKTRSQILSCFSSKSYGVLFGEPHEIDEMGIAKIIEKLILEIIAKYSNKSTFFLVDGQFSANLGSNTMKIIKGDVKHYCIAAASIAAKVSRDEIMKNYAKTFPGYCFEKHVGYGTRLHMEALDKLGICPIHRKSYKPVKTMINGQCSIKN